jgi:hypothetical protein
LGQQKDWRLRLWRGVRAGVLFVRVAMRLHPSSIFTACATSLFSYPLLFLAELFCGLAGDLTLCGNSSLATSPSKFRVAVAFQIAVSAFGCGDPPGSLCDDQLRIVSSSMGAKSYRIIGVFIFGFWICILYYGARCI